MGKIQQLYKRLFQRQIQIHEKQLPIISILFAIQQRVAKHMDFHEASMAEICLTYHRHYLISFKHQTPIQRNNRMQHNLTQGFIQFQLNYVTSCNKAFYTGDFKLKNPENFVHSLQLIQNKIEMDDFALDELKTVKSEYMTESNISFVEDSIIIQDKNSSVTTSRL